MPISPIEIAFRAPKRALGHVTKDVEDREMKCTAVEMRFSIRRWELMIASAGFVHANGVGDLFQHACRHRGGRRRSANLPTAPSRRPRRSEDPREASG